jgi:hypothetical protein
LTISQNCAETGKKKNGPGPPSEHSLQPFFFAPRFDPPFPTPPCLGIAICHGRVPSDRRKGNPAESYNRTTVGVGGSLSSRIAGRGQIKGALKFLLFTTLPIEQLVVGRRESEQAKGRIKTAG